MLRPTRPAGAGRPPERVLAQQRQELTLPGDLDQMDRIEDVAQEGPRRVEVGGGAKTLGEASLGRSSSSWSGSRSGFTSRCSSPGVLGGLVVLVGAAAMRRSRDFLIEEHEARADSSTIFRNFGEMVESENYVQPELDFDLG